MVRKMEKVSYETAKSSLENATKRGQRRDASYVCLFVPGGPKTLKVYPKDLNESKFRSMMKGAYICDLTELEVGHPSRSLGGTKAAVFFSTGIVAVLIPGPGKSVVDETALETKRAYDAALQRGIQKKQEKAKAAVDAQKKVVETILDKSIGGV